MVGRNFWAVRQGDSWIVREEGLPDKTTSHGSQDDAWQAANARAAECEGEAFLQDDNGEVLDSKWYGKQPRNYTPV
jgi:hypothetical protein